MAVFASVFATIFSLLFMSICAGDAENIPNHLQKTFGEEQGAIFHDHAGFEADVSDSTATRPFWAIAHRVLDRSAVDAAIGHGLNALEIDMNPWDRASDAGWWACHDRTPTGWGDKAKDIFDHVALKRATGANITFVWLDIKEPDMCDPESQYACSVMGLQDLARHYLLPAGIRVMYGLYGSDIQAPDSPTYNRLAKRSLAPAEAINIDGNLDTVSRAYDMNEKGLGRYPALPLEKPQRTMAKGLFKVSLNFENIKSELAKGGASNFFGRVFGWTILSSSGDDARAATLIDESRVDGLIVGNMLTNYDESSSTRGARQNMLSALEQKKDLVHLAGRDEYPW